MLKEFVSDMKEWFCNDHIRTRRGRIRAMSLLWWVIRTLQATAVIAVLYVWYCMMWLAFV